MAKNPMDMTGGMKVPSTRMRRSSALSGFSGIFALSLFLHASAIGGVVYAQMAKGPQFKVMKSIPVELVRLGKPRDPKLLPRMMAPAAPPPEEGVNLDTGSKSKASKRTKTPPKKDDKLSSAAQRLLNSAADSRLDSALSRIEEEPEGLPDGDPMGTTSDASRAANAYQAAVTRQLRGRYSLPNTIPSSQRRFLFAEVVLFIERDGQISRYEFLKTHPNKVFMSSLENLLKTTTLPAPPAKLAAEYRSTGLGVRFKP